MNKQEMMAEWLKANPEKSERDWLLEVRCSGKQREAMSRLLGKLDEALNMRYAAESRTIIQTIRPFQ